MASSSRLALASDWASAYSRADTSEAVVKVSRCAAIALSGVLLEMTGGARDSEGARLAEQALSDGRAWAKFQRICEAQGGLRVPPVSRHRYPLYAEQPGTIARIDNRKIAKLAKLAGAPDDKAAGVELHAKVGSRVTAGEPLCTVHAYAPGELAYALDYAAANTDIFTVDER